MQALLEDMRSGTLAAFEVPPPELRPGGILVRTAFSAISAGTERAHLQQVQKSMVGKALARPDLVRQVIDFAKKQGIRAAYDRVQSRLSTLSPLGYSCAGEVVEVAQDVDEFQVGDRVACAGVGYASHCEINYVPRNLAAHVPDRVSLEAASLTAIGSIACQGFRQSGAMFGESVVVIGAGLVGILTVQLAKASGCRVITIDLDRSRVERALSLGADAGFCTTHEGIESEIKRLTGHGADVAIITAATPSTEPIELAARVLRDRGKIVIVGDVGLGLSRGLAYQKELSIVLSRSYGPGRYDPQYEEEGIDYPVGYVRWTEKRNMEAFLSALASGSVDVAALIEQRVKVEEGGSAFEQITTSRSYTVLIEYPKGAPTKQDHTPAQERATTATMPSRATISVSCIGAGSFAKNVIFPELRRCSGLTLHGVATASGVATATACRSFGFAQALAVGELLKDPHTDAVFVLSRHDTHARYVLAALKEHKPVFVEKPIAVTREELEDLSCTVRYEQELGRIPFVMVGFNRRFAPLTREVSTFFAGRNEPMMVHIRVNAGYLSKDHWTQQKTGGGRIIGELCHFVDWSRFIVGAPITSVSACALPDVGKYNRDNVSVRLQFSDGSLANLLYVSNGDNAIAKEYYEVFCQGRVARLHDFKELELAKEGNVRRIKSAQDKGHRKEIEVTVQAMRAGMEAPIAFDELIEVAQATITTAEAVNSGTGVSISLNEPPLSQVAT